MHNGSGNFVVFVEQKLDGTGIHPGANAFFCGLGA